MKKVKKLAILALALALLVTGVLAGAEAFSLPWWTVDGGGGTSTSASYALSGSIGQPDAGVMTGGDYILGGGFWPGREIGAGGYPIYLPLVRR